ncbi:ferritin [Clostridium tetanomorphum]|uniref:Ferritin n=1 Tax=Clostridium tetanomorphum TaxID=1553 RepID=A0A923ECA6_CLOTT|nr:ferritin [Clostridium tetanomorphum]KAJ49300.1 ferritin [Clostridium tetanomorphum DSM 665]KAJ53063.1 ferritin [Clostridium tetanomorphum DSM 665]MBC2398399.1 ferritin [Clostridium tetanomorphum]MBP1865552.1 ferritin [Clostridium tetanomorphum]NRS86498.1 ferritin [Clostridium tetanomorphum]
MLSESLNSAINDQINYEMYSENIYLAMQAYCSSLDLDGFANFFKVQVQEERFHAMKFFDYVNQMGGRVKIGAIECPENEYESILDVFKIAYEHEQKVTRRIYNLADMATEERDHATMSFLKWFIDEQVEEENTFSTLIRKLERIGNDSASIYMLDTELAQRTFTPPTTNA